MCIMIVFCRVREADGDVAGKRFYVHEVFDKDEIKKGSPFQTGTANYGKKSGGKPLYKMLLQRILVVNPDIVSEVFDENGETETV